MRKILVVTAVLLVLFDLAMAQDASVNKNLGRVMLEGATIERAYSAALVAMTELGYRPLCGDRASGYLDFVLIQNQNNGVPDGSLTGATLVFLPQPGFVMLRVRFRHGDRDNKPEDFFRDFFSALKANLQ